MPEFPEDFTDIARALVEGDVTPVADGDNAKTMTVGAIAQYAALRGSNRTVIWRPTEPSPSGNVYATAAAALAAVSTQLGIVTILIDTSLSTACTIVPGAYPLACTELQIIAIERPNLNIDDGVTFTGGTLRALKIDSVRGQWFGSAPITGVMANDFAIDLHRNGQLVAVASSGPMFAWSAGGPQVRLHDPYCQIDALSGYELFDIDAGVNLQIFPSAGSSVVGSFVRGAGDCGVTYDSSGAVGVEVAQANLSGTYTLTDSAQNGDLGTRLTSAETAIGNLETADTALDNRLDDAEGAIEALQLANVSQIVSSTPATVTTEGDIYITATDATVVITLPDAAADRKIRFHKANSQSTQTIQLVRSAGDAGGGGTINGTASSFDIVMSGITGTRRSWVCGAGGTLAWFVDTGESTAIATNAANIGTNTTSINTLNAPGLGVQTISTSSGTVTTALHVKITATDSLVSVTLPDAATNRQIWIHKANANASQTIRLIRSAGDTGAGVINGTAASYDVVLTSVDSNEAFVSFPVVGIAALSWFVGDGVIKSLADIDADIAATNARVLLLEGPYTAAQTRVETTAAYTWASSTIKRVKVTHTSAKCVITLDKTTWSDGATGILEANNAGGFGIQIVLAAGGDTIDGLSAGTGITVLPGSTAVPSATILPAKYDVTYIGSGAWSITARIDLNSRVAAAETTISSHTSSIGTNTGDISDLKGGRVAAGNFRNITTAGPHTLLTGERLVRQGNASAMTLVLPVAAAGAEIDIIKDTTNAGGITLQRNPTPGTDTIHGAATDYVLDDSTYVTDATHNRRRWTVVCLVAGEWTIT